MGTHDCNVTTDCAYRPAYRKLTGKAYSDKTGMAPIDTTGKIENHLTNSHKTGVGSDLGTVCPQMSSRKLNGAGRIRTLGTFRFNGFQDHRDQPLCHCSRSTFRADKTQILFKSPV
jgi:hypothetical protein